MEKIRRVILRPYRKGMGPTFALTLWDTYRAIPLRPMRTFLAYRLTRNENGRSVVYAKGEDFAPAPTKTDDGNPAVRDCIALLVYQIREEIHASHRGEPLVRALDELDALEAEAEARFP